MLLLPLVSLRRPGRRLFLRAHLILGMRTLRTIFTFWSRVHLRCVLTKVVIYRIHRIFASVPEAAHVKYRVRDIVEDWVDESGTILLVGEAAHALLVSIFSPRLLMDGG